MENINDGLPLSATIADQHWMAPTMMSNEKKPVTRRSTQGTNDMQKAVPHSTKWCTGIGTSNAPRIRSLYGTVNSRNVAIIKTATNITRPASLFVHRSSMLCRVDT